MVYLLLGDGIPSSKRWYSTSRIARGIPGASLEVYLEHHSKLTWSITQSIPHVSRCFFLRFLLVLFEVLCNIRVEVGEVGTQLRELGVLAPRLLDDRVELLDA